MTGATSARTNVHLLDPSSITTGAYPDCEAGPFVDLRLGSVASLLVHEVAVLDALAVQVAAAREALVAMLAGQHSLPDARLTEPVLPGVVR